MSETQEGAAFTVDTLIAKLESIKAEHGGSLPIQSIPFHSDRGQSKEISITVETAEPVHVNGEGYAINNTPCDPYVLIYGF